MEKKQLELALKRLVSACHGERMENLPLDPARRHISIKLRRESGESKDFAHAFDVLMDFFRILELELDGYRRPYLALRLERMEQLGILDSHEAMELWKQRANLQKGATKTPEEAEQFLSRTLTRIENFIRNL